ncbi:MAG: hypothetical protein SFU56_13855 [Capsulimonadales bacterium]|nr:hypothetical protein [Capsulimonadales bacterium]
MSLFFVSVGIGVVLWLLFEGLCGCRSPREHLRRRTYRAKIVGRGRS